MIFLSCLCPCVAHMLATDNGFTGSGLSVYGSLQQLLALGHFRPGPQQSYLNVRKCVRLGMSLCKRVRFLYFGSPDDKRPCDPPPGKM